MTTRIGYFPSNNSLFVLRHRGIVEQHLSDVEWVDLRTLPSHRADVRSGLPTTHADHLFTEEGYDFIGTGFTPPITALGAGHDIVYVAVSEPRTENGRIVTRADSGITSIEDLRGKKVGIGHGSWQTTLLLLALDQAGLSWADIEPVDTAGIDAPEAFLSGELDAWTGAYPDLTRVEKATEVRTLIATEGLFSHPSLWFTRRNFATERTEELAAIVAALQESDAWIRSHPRDAAQYFVDDARAHGLEADLDAWTHALSTRPFGLNPVSEDFLDEQQRAADLLHANGLLPRQVQVRDAVLPEVNGLVTRSSAAA